MVCGVCEQMEEIRLLKISYNSPALTMETFSGVRMLFLWLNNHFFIEYLLYLHYAYQLQKVQKNAWDVFFACRALTTYQGK